MALNPRGWRRVWPTRLWLQTFEASPGVWHWRIWSEDTEILLATSAEPYKYPYDCAKGGKRFASVVDLEKLQCTTQL